MDFNKLKGKIFMLERNNNNNQKNPYMIKEYIPRKGLIVVSGKGETFLLKKTKKELETLLEGKILPYSFVNHQVINEDIRDFNEKALVKIINGSEFSLTLYSDGTVYGYGQNDYGQLGNGSTINRKIPVQVKGIGGNGFLSDVKELSTGPYHAVALLNDGTAVAWGRNYYGELSNDSTTHSPIPVQVKGISGNGFLSDIKEISPGSHYTVALLDNGTAVAWGRNNYGQLGDGSTTGRHTPVKVKGIDGIGVLSSIKEISAGQIHTVALLDNGTAVAWGYNGNGQLGDNSTTQRNTPVQVKDIGGSGILSNIKEITVGDSHTVALLNDGTAVAWGNNSNGQLGDGSAINSPIPVQVKRIDGNGFLSDIKEILTGRYYTVALLNDGTAVSWGNNYFGQLGDGSTINSPIPVLVKGIDDIGFLSDIKEISAGGYHTAALLNNGTVVAWGKNNFGQLGDNTIIQRTTPVQINVNV